MTTDIGPALLVRAEPPLVGSGYRYPGSPPFQDTDLDRKLFRGRAREADTVVQSILVSNLFVLYSVSGMGKSSLLNAGVMQPLRERGHWPVSVRVNDPSVSVVDAVLRQIEAAGRADPSIEMTLDPTEVGEGGRDDLWGALASLEIWRGNDLQQLVVVLDQFEELFTLGWSESARRTFIEQFGEVVRGFRTANDDLRSPPPPRVKFVIVVREDSLGELEALSRDVPKIMNNRFRLEALRLDQAADAILEPAGIDDVRLDSQRFEYTPSAADLILDFLRTRTVRGVEVHADVIDPTQLQILCQFVERTVLPRKGPAAAGRPIRVDEVDLGGRSGLDNVLRHFYQRTLATFPSRTQRHIRDLCETGLINRSRRRLSLERDEIAERHHVSATELQQLVNERLLRSDPRLDSVYYELAHDTLIEPILDHRDDLRAARARRRRRWVTAALIVALLVTVGALMLVLVRPENDLAGRDLRVGVSLNGAVDAGDDELFTFQPPDDAVTVVSVRPDDASTDLAVDVTSPSGGTRQADRAEAGGIERMIVLPATTPQAAVTVRVTSLSSSGGRFSVAVDPVDVTSITPGGVQSSQLAEAGDLGVYRVDGDGTTTPVMEVTDASRHGSGPFWPDDTSPSPEQEPSSAKDAKPLTTLDLDVEVISPSGRATRIDNGGAGAPERLTVPPAAGPTYVVVRGYRDSTGRFSIALADTTEVRIGVPQPIPLTQQRPAGVTFQAPASGVFVARVRPQHGEGEIEMALLRPDAGAVQESTTFGSDLTMVARGSGRFALSITSYWGAGTVEVEIDAVTPAPLGIGDWTTVDDGSVREITVGSEPVTVIAQGDDVAVGLIDAQGGSRQQFAGPEGIVASTIATPGSYLLHVDAAVGVDPAPTDRTVQAIVLPASSAVPLAGAQRAVTDAPGLFSIEVERDRPVLVRVSPSTPDVEVRAQLIDPDGGALATVVTSGASDGDAVEIPVRATRTGRYLVAIIASNPNTSVTGTLETIEWIGSGTPVTFTGSTTFLVAAEPDDVLALTVTPDADSFVDVDVIDLQGAYAFRDPTVAASAAGRPATALIEDVQTGTAQVRITLSDTASSATAVLSRLTPTAIEGGVEVTANGAASYDVAVTAEQPFEVRATSATAGARVVLTVRDPSGMVTTTSSAAAPATALPESLPADIAELFPEDVRELFAGGLPATVEEAVALLEEQDLLDDVTEVLRAHPEAQRAVFPPATQSGSVASTILGGAGAGPYRVTVIPDDPADAVTTSVAALEAQSVEPGGVVTIAAPGALVVEADTQRVLSVTGGADAVVELDVTDPFGQSSNHVTVPSSAPGEPATAIVGSNGPGRYLVMVRSTGSSSVTVVLG